MILLAHQLGHKSGGLVELPTTRSRIVYYRLLVLVPLALGAARWL